jgi:hypothetical protein
MPHDVMLLRNCSAVARTLNGMANRPGGLLTVSVVCVSAQVPRS